MVSTSGADRVTDLANDRPNLASLTLVDWHERLGENFGDLSEKRARSGWPVFALEHGLGADEVRALEAAVHRALRTMGPSLRSYLPWVVYAAEFGYRYSGFEYWQSFAEATPGWDDRSRNFIRQAFERFARNYSGAEPEGAWARAFSIICWPITHGVLPRDLQYQLAKILYNARHSLRPQLFETAQALGAHLKERSAGATSRFLEFAENELLLGQIAGALLVEEPETELLSADTLHRIVSDINEQRASAEWLNEARRATRRFNLRGLASRRDSANAGDAKRDAAARAVTQAWSDDSVAGRARLLLRPRSEGVWDALIELPDLAPLASQFPHHRRWLENSRARIVGGRDKVLAKGLLFGSGAQRRTLAEWPSPNAPLLELEGAPPELQILLQSTFRSPAGEQQLFRVAADGIAYEKAEPTVRPGETYVLRVPTPIERPAGGIRSVALNCTGGHALLFTVPDTVDDLWKVLLERLDLRPIQGLEVWPVGAWPAEWDGVGEATWLERDEILLGVKTDHAVDRIVVAFGHSSPAYLDFGANELAARIVSLGRLPAGSYSVVVSTESAGSEHQPAGRLRVNVRSERTIPAGRSERSAVALSTHPVQPALEDVWEGRLQLQLRGPGGHRARARVAMLAGRPPKEVFCKHISDLELPLEPEAWDVAFARHIRRDKKAEEWIDAVSHMRVEFDVGSLGTARFEAEREFTPLRWATRKVDGRYRPFLLDDAGSDTVRVEYRSVDHPTHATVVNYDVALAGVPIEYPGGLLLATDGTKHAAAVFVPNASLRLDQLAVHPVLGNPPHDLLALIHLAAAWQGAREKGSVMAATNKNAVVQTLLSEIAGVIGGAAWWRAERAWLANATIAQLAQLKAAVADHADERVLGAFVVGSAKDWLHASPLERVGSLADALQKNAHCFRGSAPVWRTPSAHLASSGHSMNVRQLVEFALRVASSPAAAGTKYHHEAMREYLRVLRDKPIVMRVARLAAIAVHLASTPSEEGGDAYAGWHW